MNQPTAYQQLRQDQQLRLSYHAYVLTMLLRGREDLTLSWTPTAPNLRVDYHNQPVLGLGVSGRCWVVNNGDFSPELREALNAVLAAISRPESFRYAGPRGWAVVGGPNQGPCHLAIAANGLVEVNHNWESIG
jgi:ABC-type amino acid transport substrate-binding protein